MTSEPAAEGVRVLILAPFGHDAQSLARILAGEGVECRTPAGMKGVAAELDESAGVVILTEEALAEPAAPLIAALREAPQWSDVPFIVLTAPSRGVDRRPDLLRRSLPPEMTNLLMIERPISAGSLVSAVLSALRSRRRQFEMRDRMVQLAQSEERLRLATTAASIGTWDYDPLADALQWDERCRAIFGLRPGAEVSYHSAFLAGVHPDDRGQADAAVNAALDPAGRGELNIEYRTIGVDDAVERWVAAQGSALFEDGRAVRLVGTVIDISAAKAAVADLARSQAALTAETRELDRLARTLEERVAERTAQLEAEMARRDQVETALRQSQKMEAVGQLTGGIAHDFNNMLTGILGAMDLIRRRVDSGRTDGLLRYLDAATTSAQRAAALTARLLAFSRRQSLDSKPTDINQLVDGLQGLLVQSVNEDIRLELRLAPNLPLATADANQLESAILNLALNARDAMPAGGLLTVETRRVDVDAAYAAARAELKPGSYVAVAVSDTGVGMGPELIEKVFEPFFTTKPIGQGTGLGLSMVYGFARQNGGALRVHSHPGSGTSVSILLPVAAAAARPGEAAGAKPIASGRGEVVLLVEDDASVRLLVSDVLSELGYSALEAAEPLAALKILGSEQRLDLMISDVGLPGMNGRQLAEIARQRRPELPILFIT